MFMSHDDYLIFLMYNTTVLFRNYLLYNTIIESGIKNITIC